jgi:hypothetical protein
MVLSLSSVARAYSEMRMILARAVRRAFAFALALTAPVLAQETAGGGTIVGVVRDSASRPIAGADIAVRPGDHRTTTDSTGRFRISGLKPDNYTVRARKIGYRADSWDAKLGKDGKAEVQLELAAAPRLLDTVVVSADRACPYLASIESFLCRRKRGVGLFLDYTDIDDMEKTYVGELFREIPGFDVDFRIGLRGPVYQVRPKRLSGCITSLVDGRPMSAANPIPEYADRLIAIEVYLRPDSIPEPLARFTWPSGGEVTRSGRCIVVVYWTNRAPLEVKRR